MLHAVSTYIACARAHGCLGLQVKGAMKKGTTGRKVGPLKTISGIHVDGAPLKMHVLVRGGCML